MLKILLNHQGNDENIRVIRVYLEFMVKINPEGSTNLIDLTRVLRDLYIRFLVRHHKYRIKISNVNKYKKYLK